MNGAKNYSPTTYYRVVSRTDLNFYVSLIGKACQTFLLFGITQCYASPNTFQQELMQKDREKKRI
jgi:hypothetical protein